MIKPTRDLVLVKVDKPPTVSAGGILLVEEWKTLPPKGVVLAVGPEVDTVKKGDRIMFERYASVILENDERLCKESHIMAIMGGEDGTRG